MAPGLPWVLIKEFLSAHNAIQKHTRGYGVNPCPFLPQINTRRGRDTMSRTIIDDLKHEVAMFKNIIELWKQPSCVVFYHELNDAETFITRLEGIIRGYDSSEEKTTQDELEPLDEEIKITLKTKRGQPIVPRIEPESVRETKKRT